MEQRILIERNGDSWDMDIKNVSSLYLPDLMGTILKTALEDKVITPLADETIRDIKVNFVKTVSQILGVSISNEWNDLKEVQPTENDQGPFLALEAEYPNKIYSNMYWDNEAKMFGTIDGNGYSFLTHWIKQPTFKKSVDIENRL